MSIQEVKMYTCICDNCKTSADEGQEFSCWSDEGIAREMADNAGWIQVDDRDYCENCYTWDGEDELIIDETRKNP